MSTTVSVVGNVTRVTEFWRSVSGAFGESSACWLWTGYTEDGYGQFYWDGRMVGAHELALTFTTGETRPPGWDTCHSCDRPLCCNPAHLRFDTRQGNVDDAVTRGRHATGSRNGAALAWAHVRGPIRTMHGNNKGEPQ